MDDNLFHDQKGITGLGKECSLGSLEDQISAFFSGSSDESDLANIKYNDNDDEEEEGDSLEERAAFWQAQEGLLKEILYRSSSSGSKLRREVNRAMKIARETNSCHCEKPFSNSSNECVSCLRRVVVDHLHSLGYDAALCISKWKSNRDIPGGMHEYIDVVMHPKDQKKEVRFVVEVEFRAEFQMAKASDDYLKLVNQLPESYVGKLEHLNALVRVVCEAGKRSMKEKRIHMGPWRKRKFMQMKWSGSYQRWPAGQSPVSKVQSTEVHVPIFMYSMVKVA